MSSRYNAPEYTHCIRDARFRYNVYEPEADTFLFLEALDRDAELLRSLALHRCVEIGCGSGTVITHLRCLLMPPPTTDDGEEGSGDAAADNAAEGSSSFPVDEPMFCAVDVNPLALEATGITWTDTLLKYFADTTLVDHFRRRFHAAVPSTLAAPVVLGSAERAAAAPSPLSGSSQGGVDATSATAASSSSPSPALSSTYCLQRFQGDLFIPLRDALGDDRAVFDVVLFNPPYVPTSLAELEDAVARKDVITAAWCGGPRGRVVLDRFLEQLPSRLSRCGVCYVVLIKENDIGDVVACAQRHFRAHLRQRGLVSASTEGDRVDGVEEDVVEAEEVAARYTGEHLSVYRLRYLPRYRDARCPS